MPNPDRKLYVPDKILCCLNIGFILTCLKKLMLRIWQRLLQNWAFYNQFSEGSFLCPILIENCTPLNKILSCLNIASLKKKSGFLNKALRPRSLRSLAPPTAFGRWRRVGLLGSINKKSGKQCNYQYIWKTALSHEKPKDFVNSKSKVTIVLETNPRFTSKTMFE